MQIQSPLPHGYLTHFTTIVQSATGYTNYDFVCSSLPHIRNMTITKECTQRHTNSRTHSHTCTSNRFSTTDTQTQLHLTGKHRIWKLIAGYNILTVREHQFADIKQNMIESWLTRKRIASGSSRMQNVTSCVTSEPESLTHRVASIQKQENCCICMTQPRRTKK